MHWLLGNLKILFHNPNCHAHNRKHRITVLFSTKHQPQQVKPLTHVKQALGNDVGEKTDDCHSKRYSWRSGIGHVGLLSSSLMQQTQSEACSKPQHNSEVFAYHRIIEKCQWDQFSRLESWWIMSTLPQGCELQACDSQGLTPKHKFSRPSGFQKADTCLHHHFSVDTDECSETL